MSSGSEDTLAVMDISPYPDSMDSNEGVFADAPLRSVGSGEGSGLPLSPVRAVNAASAVSSLHGVNASGGVNGVSGVNATHNGVNATASGVSATHNGVNGVNDVDATTNDGSDGSGTTDTPTETTTSTAEVIREIRSRVLTGRVVYFDGMLQNQVRVQMWREA